MNQYDDDEELGEDETGEDDLGEDETGEDECAPKREKGTRCRFCRAVMKPDEIQKVDDYNEVHKDCVSKIPDWMISNLDYFVDAIQAAGFNIWDFVYNSFSEPDNFYLFVTSNEEDGAYVYAYDSIQSIEEHFPEIQEETRFCSICGIYHKGVFYKDVKVRVVFTVDGLNEKR